MFGCISFGVTLTIVILNLIYYFALEQQETQLLQAIVVKFNHALSRNRTYYTNQQYNTLKIIPEPDYCRRSDTYKYLHPDVLLEDLYTLVDIIDLPREILRKKTFEALPNLVYTYPPSIKTQKYILDQSSKLKFPLTLSQYFPYYQDVQTSFTFGTSAMCMFQNFNHIPQKAELSQKENLMNNYFRQLTYLKKKNFSQECIENATFIPKTYRLFMEQECKEFFQIVTTQAFQNLTKEIGPQYLCKQGGVVHRGKGIFVLFEEELNNFLQYYENGNSCGQNLTSMIAQKYISNPYLYKGHKIEFRIYWFLTSTNPLILHSYQRPLIKRCALPFDLLSSEKAAHVCNTAIVKTLMPDLNQTYPQNITDGQVIIEEEEFFIDWNFEGLQERLISEGKIQNDTWLHSILYPRIYTKLISQVRSVKRKFSKDSRFAEFFATDFILSDDLEIFVLETNSNPQILSVTPDRIKRNYRMVMDTIEIQNVYLMSRFIRIRRIILLMLQIRQSGISENVREALLQSFKDRLEPGIQLSPTNLYHKVIDMNYRGPKAFNYLVQKECIY